METNARLAVVEREVTGLHADLRAHEKADDVRFAKVADSLVRIERILWSAMVIIAAVNGPSTLKALGLFGG